MHGAHLLEQHWQEVAKHKDLMVLAPDWTRYHELEARGFLLILGAFVEVDGAEVLAGYSVSIVCQHLHYVGLRYAQNDVLFVEQKWRKSKLGLQLIQRTERLAAEVGARMVTWHAKLNTALHEILPKLDYSVHETIYSKRT